MKITVEMLEEMGACEDGVEWFRKNGDDIEKAKTCRELSYFSWFVSRKLPRIDCIKYAVYSAESAQHLNADPRVQSAIDAAKAVIENDCEETRDAAYAAARSADAAYAAARSADAACAADAAVRSAYAARSADAACAADAAVRSAYAAACAAADADSFETLKKIIQYGWRLLSDDSKF